MQLFKSLVFLAVFLAGLTFNVVLNDDEAIKNIVGIDLGTTYSCVGRFKDGVVEIIPNEQGNRITPSVVAFTEQDERLVGDSAKNQIITNPTNTIFDSKRLIGRPFSDENVKKDMAYWPFKVVSKNNKPNVAVNINGKEKTFSPEEISAMVLRKMKEIAEAYLEDEVTHAVVTVPAYFNDAQRQATKDAGAIANLNIVRIINEPTAAAIAYGFNKKDEEQNILVFDLGGGTFDVSLLTIDNGVFEVVTTSGDTHLGGQDFDNRLFDYVVKEIKTKNKVDISKNVRACQRIKRECEKAKRTLSKAHQTEIELDDLLGDGELDVSIKVSRAKFNELNLDYFQNTLKPVQKVLSDAGMERSQVDEVILVGGSTRIPKVQELVQKFFNGKELNRGINPDEAVAYGAAIQAAIIVGDEQTQDLVLLDVTPLTMGIETYGGIMTKIITRNTRIPVQRSKTFSTVEDNQERVSIFIYQGEREIAKKNVLLGQFDLDGIEPAPRGVPKIDVTFEVDQNNIIKVIAEDKKTGKKNEILISNSDSRLSPEEVERMIQDSEKYANEDKEQKEKIEAKNEFEASVYSVKSLAKEKKEELDADVVETAEQAVEEALKWIEDNQSAEAADIKQRKTEFDETVKDFIQAANPGSASADSEESEQAETDHDEL